MVQNANDQEVKSREKDLFKVAKAASKQHKGDITNLITKDQDELELRSKLVSKLKEKAIEKIKKSDEKLKDSSFFISEDSMEEISDEDLEVSPKFHEIFKFRKKTRQTVVTFQQNFTFEKNSGY